MMEIIEKRLSELKHPEQNVRMHSQKQIKEYCRSISKYGQTKPMVIDEDGVILIGNGLYDALLALGRESGSCMVKAGLSEKEKKKLMLADNRIYSLGVDNMSVFDEIIAELAGDFDIPGYDDELLNSLIADTDSVDDMLSGYGIISDEDRHGTGRGALPRKRSSLRAGGRGSTSCAAKRPCTPGRPRGRLSQRLFRRGRGNTRLR